MTKLEALLLASIEYFAGRSSEPTRRAPESTCSAARRADSGRVGSLVCLDGNKGGMTMKIFEAVESLAKVLAESGLAAGASISVGNVPPTDVAALMMADRDHRMTSHLSLFGGALVFETCSAKLHGVQVTLTHPRKAAPEDFEEVAAKMRKAEADEVIK